MNSILYGIVVTKCPNMTGLEGSVSIFAQIIVIIYFSLNLMLANNDEQNY